MEPEYLEQLKQQKAANEQAMKWLGQAQTPAPITPGEGSRQQLVQWIEEAETELIGRLAELREVRQRVKLMDGYGCEAAQRMLNLMLRSYHNRI